MNIAKFLRTTFFIEHLWCRLVREKLLNKLKELIIVKKAKNEGMKFYQKYVILKEIKKFSQGFQNFVFQTRSFAE